MAGKTIKAPVKPLAKSPCATKTVEKAAPKTVAKKQAVEPVVAVLSASGTIAETMENAQVVSDEQRYHMIAEAAYYCAEKHNFKSDPLRDWVEAEKYIGDLLNEIKR